MSIAFHTGDVVVYNGIGQTAPQGVGKDVHSHLHGAAHSLIAPRDDATQMLGWLKPGLLAH